MGRRAHSPDPVTRRQVEAMAGYGVPETDIATVLAIDPKTLRRHYRVELDTGHIKANTKVAENLYRKATGDGREAVVAAIFWLKTRARWKETTVNEVNVTSDPIAALFKNIAERGRRFHDNGPTVIEATPAAGSPADLDGSVARVGPPAIPEHP